MRWFLTGVAALILLDVVISPDASGNYTAAGRAGGAIALIGSAVAHLISPAVPLVPDLRTTSSTPAASATPATLSLVPPAPTYSTVSQV